MPAGKPLSLFVALVSLSFFSFSAPAEMIPPQAASARAEELLKQLTLDEKLSLLGGKDGFSTNAIPRLNIPSLVMADGPQGVRNYGRACSFPCGAALAATWNEQLAEAYGRALGQEGRARGVHFQLGPGMNICRVPVNGRNFEYFGEDPFLASRIAANWVRGIQSQGVAATIKHFAANNQEDNRMSVDAQVDPRTLNEIYFPAFRACVEEAGAVALMSAYNRLNGSYCSGNDWLLNQTLKKDWGFQGLVMSDWGACHDTDYLAKGLDLEMGTAKFFTPDRVKQALAGGTVKQSDVDQAVRRFLYAAIRMGFLEPGHVQKLSNLPADSPASSDVALQIARQAIVLLKNDHDALPLQRQKQGGSIHRIAVYGPNADQTPTGAGGSGSVTPFHSVSFLQGIRNLAGAGIEVTYIPSPTPTEEVFNTLACAHTAPDGPPGLQFQWKPDANASAKQPRNFPAVQPSINLSYGAKRPPLGLPAGAKGTLIWSGVLLSAETGDWEVVNHSDAYNRIWLDGKQTALHEGTLIHLDAGKPISFRMEANVGGGPRPHNCKIALVPVTIPDLSAAKNADAVIACVGFNPSSERESKEREFALPESQNKLIASLAQANPRTIVVVNSGAGVDMHSWSDNAAAILQAWYLGQEGGTALAEILFGDQDPTGRLPDTFDRNLADNPAIPNYPGQHAKGEPFPTEPYREGIYVGYRGYDKSGKSPLFPFGHGLSYTTFTLANPTAEKTGDNVRVSVDVTNTGKRPGTDIVQLYLSQPGSTLDRPKRELKGFARVTLPPGESRRVDILLPRHAFASWSPEKKDWTIDPAPFTLELGHSERNILCHTTIDLR